MGNGINSVEDVAMACEVDGANEDGEELVDPVCILPLSRGGRTGRQPCRWRRGQLCACRDNAQLFLPWVALIRLPPRHECYLWRFSLRFDLDGSVRSENQKGHDLEMLGIVQIVSLVAEDCRYTNKGPLENICFFYLYIDIK